MDIGKLNEELKRLNEELSNEEILELAKNSKNFDYLIDEFEGQPEQVDLLGVPVLLASDVYIVTADEYAQLLTECLKEYVAQIKSSKFSLLLDVFDLETLFDACFEVINYATAIFTEVLGIAKVEEVKLNGNFYYLLR